MLIRRFRSDSTRKTVVSTAVAVTLLLTGIPVAQAEITAMDVEPASLVAGATGDVVVSFTTSLALSPLDTVVITFPAGFNVSGATKPTDCTGATGDGILNGGIKTLSISGQDVILTYDGDILDIWEAGAKTCTIGNITNPTTAGSTGTYTIETKGIGADGPVTVSADTIVADVISSVAYTSAPASTDADTNVTFVAEGQDQYSNPTGDAISYSVDSGSGSIDDASGVFTPNKTGTTVINASAAGSWATSSIDVTAGDLATVAFTTAPTGTDADTDITFAAKGQDANGNVVADVITYAIDSGSGSIDDASGVFTPDKTGTTVINASAAGFWVTASIDITDGEDPTGDAGGGGDNNLPERTSYGPRAGPAIQPSPQAQRDHWIEMRKGAIEAMRVLMNDATSVIVTVNTFDEPPTDLPEGYVATNVHFDIHVEPKSNVTGAEIHLQPIEAQLIGHPSDELVILHKVDGQWVEVPTTVIEEDGRLWVSFETPSFSAFTLAQKQAQTESAPATEPPQVPSAQEQSLFPWSASAILAGLLAVVAAMAFAALRKGRDL